MSRSSSDTRFTTASVPGDRGEPESLRGKCGHRSRGSRSRRRTRPDGPRSALRPASPRRAYPGRPRPPQPCASISSSDAGRRRAASSSKSVVRAPYCRRAAPSCRAAACLGVKPAVQEQQVAPVVDDLAGDAVDRARRVDLDRGPTGLPLALCGGEPLAIDKAELGELHARGELRRLPLCHPGAPHAPGRGLNGLLDPAGDLQPHAAARREDDLAAPLHQPHRDDRVAVVEVQALRVERGLAGSGRGRELQIGRGAGLLLNHLGDDDRGGRRRDRLGGRRRLRRTVGTREEEYQQAGKGKPHDVRTNNKGPKPEAWALGSERRHPDSNRGMRVLQTLALPLGYGAVTMGRDLYEADLQRSRRRRESSTRHPARCPAGSTSADAGVRTPPRPAARARRQPDPRWCTRTRTVRPRQGHWIRRR